MYNFYTGECPQQYQFKGHVNKPRSIDWYEDDMGFVSCGMDGFIYIWNLQMKDNQQRETEYDYNVKGH